ncbi:hypothetical protein [Mesonia maritima]|uniref:Membrane or secreted protein n=1 Tax=Mesonia maritima TaxID=1793873 RepID=A0ABU1K3I6_9FLAO|nr:hypothetical protein [Mesonia maritima]MDR6300180.1 hypothetical protein [Mesonia maritima]
MKKFFVLTVLFALPMVAYLFFSSGVNNFAKLPVLTRNIADLNNFTTLDGKPVQLRHKITILSFYGSNVEKMEGNAFNLNEKIYDKNFEFQDLQFVVLAENGTQLQARALLEEISTTIDTKKWNFAFGTKADIQRVFNSLKSSYKLDNDFSSPYVFIIDKDRNLRGRPAEQSEDNKAVYGYDTRSIANLTNKMTDDVKVILAEYRLALKKYNRTNASQK